MNRRTILKRLAVMAGGVALIPSCTRVTQTEVLAAYSELGITVAEDDLVKRLCEVVIPSGDGIKGANELMIEKFVLVMVNDCLDPAAQERFTGGLRNTVPLINKTFGREPEELTADEWEKFFLQPSSKGDDQATERTEDDDVKYFLNTVKQFTIQGFITSKYFMTEIMPYEMAPGRFQGKVLIDENEKVNMYG